MQYYFFKYSTGNDIGCYPQSKGARGSIDLNDISEMKYYAPTPAVSLDYVDLAYRAKLTDFVSVGFISRPGFMVNDKGLEVLKSFNLCEHQVMPSALEYRNKKYRANWFHIAEDNSRQIVFDKSSLMTFRPVPWEVPGWNYDYQKINVMNHDDYQAMCKKIGGMRNFTAEILTLDGNLRNKDMIILRLFQQNTVISEPLKLALEENKVTGWEVIPVPFPIQFED